MFTTLTSIPPYACKTLSSRFDSSSADKLETHSKRSSTVSVRVDWSSSHVLTVSNGHVLMLLWLFILNCFQKWRAETVEPDHLIRNPISWLSNRLIKLPKQIGRVSLADWLYNWGFYLMQPYLAKAPIIWLSLSVCHIHTLTQHRGWIRKKLSYVYFWFDSSCDSWSSWPIGAMYLAEAI